MFGLDYAGHTNEAIAYDVSIKDGRFVGVIVDNLGKGFVRVYFNSNATRGSKRKFDSIPAALDYIYDRRVKKGWAV